MNVQLRMFFFLTNIFIIQYEADMKASNYNGPSLVVKAFVELELDTNVCILDVLAGSGLVAQLVKRGHIYNYNKGKVLNKPYRVLRQYNATLSFLSFSDLVQAAPPWLHQHRSHRRLPRHVELGQTEETLQEVPRFPSRRRT